MEDDSRWHLGRPQTGGAAVYRPTRDECLFAHPLSLESYSRTFSVTTRPCLSTPLHQETEHPCNLSAVNRTHLVSSTCVRGPATGDRFILLCRCFVNWCNIFVSYDIIIICRRKARLWKDSLKGRYINVRLHYILIIKSETPRQQQKALRQILLCHRLSRPKLLIYLCQRRTVTK